MEGCEAAHGLLSPAHLMTWFNERVISTRLRLFSATLAAMYSPIASSPFHCLRSVSRCLPTKGGRSMNGSSIRALKAM